jgi:hypothetical protein
MALAKVCFETASLQMEKTFTRTARLSSYNILSGRQIIGNADINYMPDGQSAIEIYPYKQQLELAKLSLTPQPQWVDFQETTTTEDEQAVEAVIRAMLKTIISGYVMLSHTIILEKRKDVFELTIEKKDKARNLVMVYDLLPFVTQIGEHNPAIVVHEREEFDIWRFPVTATIEEIIDDVYAGLR